MKKKKEELNYFDEFIENVKLTKEAADELSDFIFNYNFEKTEEKMRKIHSLEMNADRNLHKLKNYLLNDFLPPIDREDIIAISHKIDDLMDEIDEVAINFNILNLEEMDENIETLINLLTKTIDVLVELVTEFKTIKKLEKLKDKIVEVNALEGKADRIYEDSIRELFAKEKNAIKILKLSKIYEEIENCFDAAENVADGIEEVLMKNG